MCSTTIFARVRVSHSCEVSVPRQRIINERQSQRHRSSTVPRDRHHSRSAENAIWNVGVQVHSTLLLSSRLLRVHSTHSYGYIAGEPKGYSLISGAAEAPEAVARVQIAQPSGRVLPSPLLASSPS